MPIVDKRTLCIGRPTKDGKIELYTGFKMPGCANPELYNDIGSAISALDDLHGEKDWKIYSMKIEEVNIKTSDDAIRSSAKLMETGNF